MKNNVRVFFLFLLLLVFCNSLLQARQVKFTNRTKKKIYISYAYHVTEPKHRTRAVVNGWYGIDAHSSQIIDLQLPEGKKSFYLYGIQEQRRRENFKKLDEDAMQWPSATEGQYMMPVKYAFYDDDATYNKCYVPSKQKYCGGKQMSKPPKPFYKVHLKHVQENEPVEIIFKNSTYLYTRPGNVRITL